MSLLFGGGPKQKPQYSGIQLQTSSSTIAVPIGWGFTRVAPNLIDYEDFKSHKQKVKAGKGMPKATTYTYSATVLMALSWGEISGVDRVFRDNEKQTSYSALGLSLFTGSDPQAPWGYMVTAHPDKAFNYPGIAYLAAANYDLGNSANLPQHAFEVRLRHYDSAGLGTGDALPSLIIDDFIRDPKIGCIGATDIIDETTLFSSDEATTTGDASYETYCRVMGFGLSPILTDQESAGETIERWMKLTNSAIVWTGYSLKFIPYGCYEITANGYHYKPEAKTPVYSISSDDFIQDNAEDPFYIERTDPADANNSLKLKFNDRSNEYNPKPVEWKDQGLIDQFGLRQASDFAAPEICLKDMAGVVAQLIGERAAYIRNKYTFTLGAEYVLLEPADIITIPDPKLGEVEVIITAVNENEDGDFEIEADEHKASVTHIAADTFIPQGATASGINSAVDPGAANAPIIFEPPAALSGSAQIWAAVSGGPNWGGALVYVSTDNITYQAIGTIDTPARMGVLTAALATTALANPVTQTLAVNLAQSQGDLMSVSASDAAASVTLSYVNGEYIAFRDATLTSAYHYDLTTLYRGLYGTAKPTHNIGEKYARLDESIFKADLESKYVGVPLYFKFQSFNIFGITYQDLADCTAYTYTPTGVAVTTTPGTPTGLTVTGVNLANIVDWTAPTTGGTPSEYKIYGIHGSSGAFGAATLIGSVTAPVHSFTHSGLGISDTWRYFVTAVNDGGEGAATAGSNGTTTSTGGGGSATLVGLTDVAVSSPANFQVIRYNSGTSKYVNSTLSLSYNSDVGVSGVTDKQFFGYDAGIAKWRPYTLQLNLLSDINLSVAPTDGQALVFDSASSKFKPVTLAARNSIPLVTGEVPPVLVYLDDGSLVTIDI